MIRAAVEKREADRAKQATQAADLAQRLWETAKPATTRHPYLATKAVPAIGLRQDGDTLLVPLQTATGQLVNLQRIYPNGAKRFLPGGTTKGVFALVGATQLPQSGEVYLCEGVATALTIAKSLRLPVAAAMNCHNLKRAALAIREHFPRIAICLAADYDHRTPGNPGLHYAKEAAKAVDGAVTWPTLCGDSDCRCTDFNDTSQCRRVAQ